MKKNRRASVRRGLSELGKKLVTEFGYHQHDFEPPRRKKKKGGRR